MSAPSPQPLSISATDWLLLILLSVLWGGAFYFAKIAVLEIPPLTLALGRVAIAAGTLVLLMQVMTRFSGGPLPRDRATWIVFAVMALLNNVIPFALVFWAQIHISIGLASILNATSPLFSVVVAHLLTADDKLTPGRGAGLVAGFIGVVLLIGPDLLGELGAHVWAQLACLAAACSYAFGAVYSRRLRAVPPLTVATGQLTMSAVWLLPAAFIVERPAILLSVSSAALWALVALAVVSTAFAYLIYFRIIARAGATNALLVTFLIPVSAILLGMLLLGERLEWHQIAGMVAIFVGLAAIDGRALRWMGASVRQRADDDSAV
jgi:drug/metabolite transporter (DMT)-like permease